MDRVLHASPERKRELGCVEQDAQHGRDVAIRLPECRRHPIDQPSRGVIGNKEERELPADEARRRRSSTENVERLVDFRQAAPRYPMSEKCLVAVVVTCRPLAAGKHQHP